MMRRELARSIVFVAICFVAVGCAQQRVRQALDSAIGRTREEVIALWGAPDYETSRMLVYEKKHHDTMAISGRYVTSATTQEITSVYTFHLDGSGRVVDHEWHSPLYGDGRYEGEQP